MSERNVEEEMPGGWQSADGKWWPTAAAAQAADEELSIKAEIKKRLDEVERKMASQSLFEATRIEAMKAGFIDPTDILALPTLVPSEEERIRVEEAARRVEEGTRAYRERIAADAFEEDYRWLMKVYPEVTRDGVEPWMKAAAIRIALMTNKPRAAQIAIIMMAERAEASDAMESHEAVEVERPRSIRLP